MTTSISETAGDSDSAPEDFVKVVAAMVRDCEDYRDERAADRIRAIEYHDGTMTDTPADQGRSRVVSRDVRAAVKRIKPSIVRTILGNDEVVEYLPVGQDDEEGAAQASDYVNYVVLPECRGRQAIGDAIHDALLLRNGILRWWYDERIEVSYSSHTGLDDTALSMLVIDDEVEVLEHTARDETVDGPEGPQPSTVHDVRLRRRATTGRVACAAVPPEEFLIHPDALTIADAAMVGQKSRLRRSDLVAMGYDRDQVWDLPISGSGGAGEDIERLTRRDVFDRETHDGALDRSMQEVDYYELYVRIDQDEDGIAELRHMCFAGAIDARGLLRNEECDEVQFCELRCERRSHQWEGASIADDVMEIQRIKTVLLRGTLDNIYWQNNRQPIYVEGRITDLDPVMNPTFGRPIAVNGVSDVRQALSFAEVPFVGRDTFAMLDYLNQEIADRTGISEASSGLAPDALQNMTAKASAMIEQAGIGQTELMVRTIADGLATFFRGLLRLVIRHQDRPRTVRLRDKWTDVDPRHWNAEMDAVVNVGLGAGTRERDMVVMQLVLGVQEKLLAAFGPDNPFVKPENLYNAISKQIEAAGLKTPRLYITEPDPQEVAQKLKQSAGKQDPAMAKVQAQAAADQAKLSLDERKMQAEIQLKREQMTQELALKREQLVAELQLRRELAMTSAAMGAATSPVRIGGDPG